MYRSSNEISVHKYHPLKITSMANFFASLRIGVCWTIRIWISEPKCRKARAESYFKTCNSYEVVINSSLTAFLLPTLIILIWRASKQPLIQYLGSRPSWGLQCWQLHYRSGLREHCVPLEWSAEVEDSATRSMSASPVLHHILIFPENLQLWKYIGALPTMLRCWKLCQRYLFTGLCSSFYLSSLYPGEYEPNFTRHSSVKMFRSYATACGYCAATTPVKHSSCTVRKQYFMTSCPSRQLPLRYVF